MAIETKIATQIEMNIPKVCYKSSGRAFNEMQVNLSLSETELNELQKARIKSQESNEKLLRMTQLYINLLAQNSLVFGSGKLISIAGDFRNPNLSGSTVLIGVRLDNFSKSIRNFTEQCVDDGNFHQSY